MAVKVPLRQSVPYHLQGRYFRTCYTNTLRVAKVFWGLDATLLQNVTSPSMNWLTSYSLYDPEVGKHMDENVHANWSEYVQHAIDTLQEEASLEEIVRLVGLESLSERDRLAMMTAKMLREDFLQQNAFDDIDTFHLS